MKKFFGLKMTLAALAVVSFASCYDSEGGDVIIPQQTTIDWPAPVYTVLGHVTDRAGSALSDVEISGLLLGQKTDLNGDFSATLNAPFNGEINFTKEGYYRSTRTLKMPTLKTGAAVFNVDAVMYTLDDPMGALKEKDVVIIEDEGNKVEQTADYLADRTGIDFTNETDNAVLYSIRANVLSERLVYGVKAVAAKSDLEEQGELAFLTWFNQTEYSLYQESPFGEYADYRDTWKTLTFSIPANFKATKVTFVPLLTEKTLIFPLEEGDYEQPVEIYDSYVAQVDGIPLDHPHQHGDGNNAGGGEVGGE